MSDELEQLNANLDALHAKMRKRKASTYRVGEIEEVRNQQRDLLHRIALLVGAAEPAPI